MHYFTICLEGPREISKNIRIAGLWTENFCVFRSFMFPFFARFVLPSSSAHIPLKRDGTEIMKLFFISNILTMYSLMLINTLITCILLIFYICFNERYK
jgi:hypothetical protein